MLNVGGADYDESVERGWWLEGRGGTNVEEMEQVVFPTEDEDGSVLANRDVAAANGDRPLATLGGFPPPPPAGASGIDDDELPPPRVDSPHLEFGSVPGVIGECRRLRTMRSLRWPPTS